MVGYYGVPVRRRRKKRIYRGDAENAEKRKREKEF
jgi:hypothetical protein